MTSLDPQSYIPEFSWAAARIDRGESDRGDKEGAGDVAPIRRMSSRFSRSGFK